MKILRSNNGLLKFISIYYINILLLLVYSSYVNGYLLYRKGLVTFLYIFKPFLMVLVSLLISYLIKYIYLKYVLKSTNIKDLLIHDFNPIFISLIVLALPVNINIYIFILSIILINILMLFIKNNIINYYTLFKLLIMLILFIIGKYTYQNYYNINVETNYHIMDLFLGMGVGGIGTTSILLIIICYFIFISNRLYKREIPLISLVTYLIIMVISCLIFKLGIIKESYDLLRSSLLYGFVFIETISYYSEVETNKRIIYAVLVGILTYIFNKLINIYEGVFVAILISNVIMYFINKKKV